MPLDGSSKTLKLGRQYRFAQINAGPVDATTRSTTLTFSDETPVDRFFGKERLLHDEKSVRMERINAGAPLLFNHDRNDPIGIVVPGSARIGSDRRSSATVTFFDTPRGLEVMSMVNQGLRNTSVGYDIHAVREMPKEEGYDVTDWEPGEISIVTVPAVTSVGVGRSDPGIEHDVRVERAAVEAAVRDAEPQSARAATTEGVQMDTSTTVAATTTAATAAAAAGEGNQVNAVEIEKQRRDAIINLCKSNKLDHRIQASWIERGVPLTEVAKEILDVMEERGKADPVTASAIGLSGKDTQRYSLFRAIRALHYGGRNPEFMRDAAFEIECSAQIAKQLGRGGSTSILVPGEVLQRSVGREAANRAMSVVPGAKGGYMVNTDNMGFIDILRNRSVAMRMGARVLSGLQGNVTFPRQTGKVSVTWQAGEGTSVTAADQALGQLSMTPKTCIAITDVSEQLLRQASPSAEAFVMADLAADVAIDGVDAATINGTGGAQPLGIKNTTGITSGQDASSATYAKILAFVSTAGGSNAIRGNPGWVTTTAGAARLMQVQRFSSTDTPVWTGNMLDGNLVGFNAMSSEQMASGNLIFGSWDELVIGEWGVLELSTDNGGTRFNTAQVGIRAMWMVDVLLRYPQAFVVSTNLS